MLVGSVSKSANQGYLITSTSINSDINSGIYITVYIYLCIATLGEIKTNLIRCLLLQVKDIHDDIIKWKHFPRNWPFVREIHRSPVNFPHKGQWRGALMFSLIYAWINDWVNNREAGDLRRQHGHYDVIVMNWSSPRCWFDAPRPDDSKPGIILNLS